MSYRSAIVVSLLLGVSGAGAAEGVAPGVAVAPEGKGFRVRTAAYEAVVAEDGGLSRLRVGGEEFLPPAGSVTQGTYCYQGGVLRTPELAQPAPNRISAKGDKAGIEYEFGPEGMTWTLTNTSPTGLEFVLLFDAGVNVVRDDQGTWWKPPVECTWPSSTWCRGRATLQVDGCTKLWGPFAKGFQVWIAALAPGQAHRVTLRAGTATDAELAAAAKAQPGPRAPAKAAAAPAAPPAAPKDFCRIEQPTYAATVAADGCLTSLQVGGQEFFRTTPVLPRGIYLFQGGPLALPRVERPSESVVTAASDKATVRYEFAADGITCTVTNLTAERLLALIVFEPAVQAVQGGDGSWEKPPVSTGWSRTTWFRGRANLRIEGGTRVWGPWSNERLQVWEASVEPKASRTVSLKPSVASEEEIAEAMKTASQPPPPTPTDPTGPMWDLAALSTAPQTWPAEGFAEPGVQALFYAGPPLRGKPTRVFAWLGFPKEMKPGEKVPGMVLVHGGGGTAFANWVRLWTERGYAAISMDTCGCVPKGTYGNWERHDAGGPPGWGGWDQIDRPREDQWTYHAVAAAVLGHSLLRAQPQVDAGRIGLTGISWGGYLTCILAGVDSRLRFSAPVYGCGFTNEHNFAGSVAGLGPEGAARWLRWWDPSVYLPKAAAPMLWVTGSNDFAYTPNALQKSYRLPTGPRTLAVRLRMPHGHGPAGEGPKEIGMFADSLLRDGLPLPRISGQGRDGREVWAAFESRVKVVRAELNVTADAGDWKDRNWVASPAGLDAAAGKVTATLPEGTRVYYLNLFDERDCVVSTEHEELQPR